MKTVRVKTVAEFERDYGENWINYAFPVDKTTTGGYEHTSIPRHLLGKTLVLSDEEYDNFTRTGVFTHFIVGDSKVWFVTDDMVSQYDYKNDAEDRRERTKRQRYEKSGYAYAMDIVHCGDIEEDVVDFDYIVDLYTRSSITVSTTPNVRLDESLILSRMNLIELN